MEPPLEVVPQELGLENLPSGPGEPLHCAVKEESDTEQESGKGHLFPASGAVLETFGGCG